MILAAPIAGLIAGLLGSAIVVLLYLLKLRRRPVAVSTTMLWRRAVRDMEGNVPWQAARPSVLMLLHLLVVGLIAIAIARPSIGSTASDQRIVIVIDTSASMNAIVSADGSTRLDRARERAEELVRRFDRSSGSPELIVYRVGAGVRLVAGPTRESRRVLRAINSIEPSDEPGDLASVFDQIRATMQSVDQAVGASDAEQDSPRSTRVFVLTDGGAGDLPDTVEGSPIEVIALDPSPVVNAGLIALSAERDRTTPTLCRVFVRVQSTDPEPSGMIVRVLDSGEELARGAIAFDAEGIQTQSTTLEFTLDQGAELEVVIDHPDAMDADNRAWVRLPDPNPVRVVVVADGAAHPILLDVLSAIAGREPAVIGADEPIPAWAELVVFDGVLGPDQTDIPSIAFGPSGDNSGIEEVVSWKRSHPVLRDVAMGLVAFDSPRSLVGEEVLASSDEKSVMIEHASRGVRHFDVAFDLDRSNWPVQVGFTIFLANAVEYLVPGASGIGVVTRTDELLPMVGVQEIPTPEGSAMVGVSLLDASESLAGVSAGVGTEIRERAGAISRSVDIDRPVWRWFVVAALALMTIEWLLHAARVRI